MLNPYKTIYGYLQVTLRRNNKSKLYRLHRLVAQEFLENKNKHTEVNHINGNKTDNRAENLEWCSRSYNQKQAYLLGLQKPKKSKENILSKKVEQYDLQGNLIKLWDSVGDIQRTLNIKKQYISACCLGKIKTSNKYIWKYKDTH